MYVYGSYEIQLSEEVRRKGLGKFLMQILELMAFKYVTAVSPACIEVMTSY